MSRDFDVLIVGGGVAGAVLALALAQAGKKILILERDAAPALNGADVLKPAGIEVMRRLGLLKELMLLGRRRDAVHVFHNGTFLAALDYKASVGDDFFVLVPYANVLQVTRAALERSGNVTYRCSSPVAALHMNGPRVDRVELLDGGELRAHIYVGADGAHSLVRRQAGLAGEREVYGQRLYFGKFPRVESVEQMNRLYVDSDGGLAYFYPVGHDAFRTVLGFPEEEGEFLTVMSVEHLRARLRRFVSESEDAVESITPLSSFARIPVARMHAPRYGRENLVLLGDAIHCVHPITGQGMNLSIEDAGALAPLLIDTLEGRCSPQESVTAYERARRPINEAVVAYGHALTASMTDRHAFMRNFDMQMQASRR